MGRAKPAARAGRCLFGLVLLLAVSCTGDSAPTVVQADYGAAGFPRTAVCFLAHTELPAAEMLARYDVVVIDHEWAHRKPASFFAQLRAVNPQVKILAYVDLVDYPPELGTRNFWANSFRLWQFEDSSTSRFPAQWLARGSDGTTVSEYPDTLMTNLTDRAPEVNGQRFTEYAADWVVEQVWSAGVWDGVFLDVWGDRIFTATRDRWDIDADGTDEPDSVIYGLGNPWERGIDEAERIIRERMPEAILVANGDRTLRAGQLDGRVWESFGDPTRQRDLLDDLESYVDLSASGDHRQPGLAITINQQVERGELSTEDFRRARWFLSATLLQNGYWAGMGADYGQLVYYDELFGGGRGRGYLGNPVVSNPTWPQLQGRFAGGIGRVEDGLYRRDFEHGIVLHNAADQPRTVTLERPYRRISGTVDPRTNDGTLARTVTVPAQDGLVLLRE
ncbi:MAG: putative glycoside hydrolase [Pseudonocardiales bacterium]